MRWGDHLEFSDEVRPGDFIYVPPYVPHQEINASPDEICEAVVVRDGQDPIVVNLDLGTPEPASSLDTTEAIRSCIAYVDSHATLRARTANKTGNSTWATPRSRASQ